MRAQRAVLGRLLITSVLAVGCFSLFNCGGDDSGDADGTAGSSGEAGSAGTRGDTGSAGTRGDTGSAGTSGDTGSAGTSGDTATAGAAGTGGTPADRVDTCYGPDDAALDNVQLPDGYCAWTFADGVADVRGIIADDAGNLLVIERGTNSVVLLNDADGDGTIGGSERVTLAEAPGLNHGIAIHGGYLYASSATTVYRWPYAATEAPSDAEPLTGREEVVQGIPGGGHTTRTLVFDGEGNLYVSVGSGGNVDSDSERSRIRRFDADELDGGAIDFDSGEVFADGLRNEVGLRFDDQERLWGVENGLDNLERADLGGDIHNDNPGEELNLFEEPGAFYGYPYCWSEGQLAAGMGPSTQWAHPAFIDDGTHTDAWCQDPDNVVPPVLSMQAHSAPLDLIFYPGGSFPESRIGGLFVTFHGSWNRDAETGYKVVYVPFENGMPTGEVEDFFGFDSETARGAGWPHRPVGLAIGTRGELFVTSDASNRVIAIGYAE